VNSAVTGAAIFVITVVLTVVGIDVCSNSVTAVGLADGDADLCCTVGGAVFVLAVAEITIACNSSFAVGVGCFFVEVFGDVNGVAISDVASLCCVDGNVFLFDADADAAVDVAAADASAIVSAVVEIFSDGTTGMVVVIVVFVITAGDDVVVYDDLVVADLAFDIMV